MSKYIRSNKNSDQSFHKARASESTKQIIVRESIGGLAIAIVITLWQYFFTSPQPSLIELATFFLAALIIAVVAFGLIGLATREYSRKKLRH